jgi:hypothetical protein
VYRIGFKTPSKAQWQRCPARAGFASDFIEYGAAQPPANAHIPMYAGNNDFPDRPDALMHTLICLDQICNPASAGPLDLI